MLVVPEEMRKELRKPLGELLQFGDFLEKYGKRKIIAVGDIVTLALLGRGMRPFAAVYDFRSMRSELEKEGREKISSAYPSPLVAENPPGKITDELEKEAEKISKAGGALFVEGEEDLAALVFMRISPRDCVIMYGQPGEGVVAVECNEKSRKKAEELFKKMRRG